MSTKGRKPAPTSLKILKNMEERRINRGEPKPAEGVPEAPDYLSPLAREKWGEMVRILTDMKVLTVADGEALALYCQSYDFYCQACNDIREDGIISSTAVGGLKSNPAVQVARDMMALMLRIQTEFGMTPSSRGRINLGDPKGEADPLDKMIAEGNKRRSG